MWLEIVLACAVLVLVVALAIVLLQIRGIRERTSGAMDLKERPHGILDAYDARYLSGHGFVAFDVPDEPDLYLMFGRGESIEASGAEVVHSVPRSLARTAVGLDALAKAGIEVGQQTGMLVRLTKKSTQAYREGRKLIDSSGATMGVVQNSSGKFRHVLRFKPATGAQVVSSATGVLSAIAMQAQLASIEHAIAEVAADVVHIERTQQNLISSEMKAVDGLLRETYNAATTSGELTDIMWDQMAGVAVLVRKHDELSAVQLADITRELEQQKSVKDRRAWLRKNRS